MTDYYTNVCFELPVDGGYLDFCQRLNSAIEDYAFGDAELDDFDSEIASYVEQVVAPYNNPPYVSIVPGHNDKIVIEGFENVNLDPLATIVQCMLDHAQSDNVVKINWSADASKPTVDAYGGGVILVSRLQVEFFPHYQVVGAAIADTKQALAFNIPADTMRADELYAKIATILVLTENGRPATARRLCESIVGDTRWHDAAFEEYRA